MRCTDIQRKCRFVNAGREMDSNILYILLIHHCMAWIYVYIMYMSEYMNDAPRVREFTSLNNIIIIFLILNIVALECNLLEIDFVFFRKYILPFNSHNS